MNRDLRQGCVLAPLLFDIFFAAIINVVYSRFKANKDFIGVLVHLREKMGAGVHGEAIARESVLTTCFGACFTLTMPESSCNHSRS